MLLVYNEKQCQVKKEEIIQWYTGTNKNNSGNSDNNKNNE